MSRELRVLEILRTVPQSPGGIENFVFRAVEGMDRTGLRIDFLSAYPCMNRAYVNRAERTGGKVYTLSFRHGMRKPAMFARMVRFLRNRPYDVIHVHSGWIMELTAWAAVARIAGTGRVILHSHCAGADENPYAQSVKAALCRMPAARFADECCACSRFSAEYTYGRKAANRIRVIRDGIPAERFRFNPAVREALRSRYFIPETGLVAGYVANFYPVKNHMFLLDVFGKILEKQPGARLLLVGEGEEKDRVLAAAEQRGIADRVIFTGTTDRVQDYLQMMDVFVFPSRNEGLGMAAVEAQAAGLPVVASEGVRQEAAVTDNIVFLPLSDGAEAWAETALRMAERVRTDRTEQVRACGYDIRESAGILREMYRASPGEQR